MAIGGFWILDTRCSIPDCKILGLRCSGTKGFNYFFCLWPCSQC